MIVIVRNRLGSQIGQDRLLACTGPAILHHLPGYSLGRILGPLYWQVQVLLQPYAESLINFQIVQTLPIITMEDSYTATF